MLVAYAAAGAVLRVAAAGTALAAPRSPSPPCSSPVARLARLRRAPARSRRARRVRAARARRRRSASRCARAPSSAPRVSAPCCSPLNALAARARWARSGSSGGRRLHGCGSPRSPSAPRRRRARLARAAPRVSARLSLARRSAGSASCSPTSRSPSVADGLPLVPAGPPSAVRASPPLARGRAARRPIESVALAGLGGHLLLALAHRAHRGALAAASGCPSGDAACRALAALPSSAWAAARLLAPAAAGGCGSRSTPSRSPPSGCSRAVALSGRGSRTARWPARPTALAALARRRAGDPLPCPAAIVFLGPRSVTAWSLASPRPPRSFEGLVAPLATAVALATLRRRRRARRAAPRRTPASDRRCTALSALAALLPRLRARVDPVPARRRARDRVRSPSSTCASRVRRCSARLWALAGVGALVAGPARATSGRCGSASSRPARSHRREGVRCIDLASLTSLYRVGLVHRPRSCSCSPARSRGSGSGRVRSRPGCGVRALR